MPRKLDFINFHPFSNPNKGAHASGFSVSFFQVSTSLRPTLQVAAGIRLHSAAGEGGTRAYSMFRAKRGSHFASASNLTFLSDRVGTEAVKTGWEFRSAGGSSDVP